MYHHYHNDSNHYGLDDDDNTHHIHLADDNLVCSAYLVPNLESMDVPKILAAVILDDDDYDANECACNV